jgi:hypothetical protein
MKGYKVEGKYRRDLRGWWDESERHRLARMGVKGVKAKSPLMGATLWNEKVRKMTLKEFLDSDFDNDGVPNKYDKYPFNPVNYRYHVDFSKKRKDKYDIEKDFFLKGEHSVKPRVRNGEQGNVFLAVSDILTPLPEIDYSFKDWKERQKIGFDNAMRNHPYMTFATMGTPILIAMVLVKGNPQKIALPLVTPIPLKIQEKIKEWQERKRPINIEELKIINPRPHNFIINTS